MTEQEQKPYITIDDVNVYVEDLPDEGQQIFGRLQRLNQKKAAQTLDLEETQGAINFFSSKIVEIVNEDKSGVKVEKSETKEVPSDTETQDS
tara:strand:- start:6999 stop:7274 length:276 start_codon:yes stop_codon:yes gene_type:complete